MRLRIFTLNARVRRAWLSVGLLALAGAAQSVAGIAQAQSVATAGAAAHTRKANGPVVPDRFTAVTDAMTPSGVSLRIDVRQWSDADARAAAVEALGGGDAAKALAELPTVGYVWQLGSGVGYAVKYAHRVPAADGGERLTFVTDRRLGRYELKPWSANATGAPSDAPYSVVELYLDAGGKGSGTLSLAASVKIDAEQALVSLEPGAPAVLKDAAAQPRENGNAQL
jgi:hypothetical protein